MFEAALGPLNCGPIALLLYCAYDGGGPIDDFFRFITVENPLLVLKYESLPWLCFIYLWRISGFSNSIPWCAVITTEEAKPLVAPEPPPGIWEMFLFLIIFWSFWIPTLSLPPIPIIPMPLPVYLNSTYASAPNGIIFCIFLACVSSYFFLKFLTFLPALFLRILESGLGRGLRSFGYWGAMIFPNLVRISSLNFRPSLPLEQVPQASILAAIAVFPESMRIICIENFGGACKAKSTSAKCPLCKFALAVDNPWSAFFYYPMTCIFPEGILESSTIPPAAAINFAATLVPTIADTLGAIKFILLSKKFNIFCLFSSRPMTSSHS